MTVTVASSLDASFVVNSDEVQGCAPLTVSFMKSSAGSGDCFYTLSNGTVLNGCNPTYTFTQSGCYDVTLTVDDGQGCSGTFTEINMICVDAPPKASFEMNPMQLNTLSDEVQFTNTSVGANTYQWFFGDGGLSSEIHPAHVYDLEEKQYTITLVAVSELGCRDTTSLTIGVEEELIYYVPNSFTPDGDVHNPTFKPVFTDGFDPMDYHLTIFNRWGETVFESHDAEIGWDGRYGIDEAKSVKEGVYIYKIRFKKKYSAEYIELVGHVSLLR
ncbi:MAG TPA: PKD domain-containing protein [Brumimicrobium sp.]|nr:PKD domain-containing protein [Brumimicrobium sp.]